MAPPAHDCFCGRLPAGGGCGGPGNGSAWAASVLLQRLQLRWVPLSGQSCSQSLSPLPCLLLNYVYSVPHLKVLQNLSCGGLFQPPLPILSLAAKLACILGFWIFGHHKAYGQHARRSNSAETLALLLLLAQAAGRGQAPQGPRPPAASPAARSRRSRPPPSPPPVAPRSGPWCGAPTPAGRSRCGCRWRRWATLRWGRW